MAWIDVADRAALARSGRREVEAAGIALLLYDLEGALYATSAICPHHAAWLSQGSVEGEIVNCPRHMGQFHIPTGRQLRGPACPDLRTYPVREEGGRIWIELP
ncbi:naphthalene 1,2-dioxygenase system ferredoxin subunit [Enhydrobacter aerosaccus]|uniref:Naphthalene 1,2-dioxygenase system ferredoxin subunit n=1 Tax=Enhydrobacter aerosaccus TaxID=225324 RepID=A0A1T4R9Z2_9HYPH|nr:non-heme iron oxygenase ferredoxin subunit [Enhydrobacter aerosaccus]SKA12900.1 naphthalene 1,2-dioxygenase system ferredoxin subunit [Enhydrobacter aerosaccus]